MVFRERVLNREFLIGTHTGLNNATLAEIMANCGYDFIWIDNEHTAVDYDDLLHMLMAIQAAGAAVVVRAPVMDLTRTKHILEMGPDAILFPMINTAEEAARAMDMTLYPPEGSRGFGPLRSVKYGLIDSDEFIKTANQRLCRLIQIESETAVKNLPEIVKNPWIDGFVFGPCDMSGSIGELNKVFGENTQKLIREAVEIIKAAGKSIGVSTASDDPQVLKFWHDLGINIISSSMDYLYVARGAMKNYHTLKALESHDAAK